MANRLGVLAVLVLAGMARAQNRNLGSDHVIQGNQRIHPEVFFTGQVQVDGGSAPADPVAMTRVCNGQSHFETWTDAKGDFSFHVGVAAQNSSQADASENSMARQPALGPALTPMSDTPPSIVDVLRNCELQARLAGYRADAVNISISSHFDDGRLGVITLHPISKASTLSVSATTLAAPAGARKAYEKGFDALAKGKWQAAADQFSAAVAAYPKFAGAWYQLGLLRQKNNDDTGALDAWKHAVASDPLFLSPYENLTILTGSHQDWVSSEGYSRAWIRLDPEDFPGAYLFNAIANQRLNHLAEAEAAARDGLRVDRFHRVPKLSFVLAMVLMDKHENAEAVQRFRDYLALSPDAKDAAAVRQQVALLDATIAAHPQ
jgi:tetratricopeptide (TPR) repeat protein